MRPAIYGRCIYTGMMDANKWPKTKRIREAWQRHIPGETTVVTHLELNVK